MKAVLCAVFIFGLFILFCIVIGAIQKKYDSILKKKITTEISPSLEVTMRELESYAETTRRLNHEYLNEFKLIKTECPNFDDFIKRIKRHQELKRYYGTKSNKRKYKNRGWYY